MNESEFNSGLRLVRNLWIVTAVLFTFGFGGENDYGKSFLFDLSKVIGASALIPSVIFSLYLYNVWKNK